jgi:membrane protease YdiL (CAAX protease family)
VLDQQHDGAEEVRIEELRHRHEERGREIGAAHLAYGSICPVDRSPAARAPHGRDLALGSFLILAGLAFASVGSERLRSAPESSGVLLEATLAAQAFFACTALGVRLLVGPSVLPRGLRLGRPRLRAFDLVLLVLGVVCASHALSLVITALELRDTGTLAEIDRVVAATAEGPSWVLAFVALGLAPAFGEELLFRGLVQQAAVRRVGAAAAVLISSAAFGLIHVDPVHSPAAFVLGLFLGTAAELGDSVWVAVLCHGVNNALSVALPAFGLAVPPGAPAVLVALALLGAAVALFLAVARRTRARERASEGAGPPGAASDFSAG